MKCFLWTNSREINRLTLKLFLGSRSLMPRISLPGKARGLDLLIFAITESLSLGTGYDARPLFTQFWEEIAFCCSPGYLQGAGWYRNYFLMASKFIILWSGCHCWVLLSEDISSAFFCTLDCLFFSYVYRWKFLSLTRAETHTLRSKA